MITIEVRNVGTGAALGILPTVVGSDTTSEHPMALYAAGPDTKVTFGGLTVPQGSSSFEVKMAYVDISGRQHSSHATVLLWEPRERLPAAAVANDCVIESFAVSQQP